MSGKVIAVVTGSNKGIGFAIVQGLCENFKNQENAVVYLTARDEERGKNAVKQLNGKGYFPQFHQLDVTDQSSIDRFKNYLKDKYGHINILVNNAAIAFKTAATEPFAEQAETTIHVNYFGLLNVCEALFPLLASHARVVNISSSAGHLLRIPGAELRKKLSNPNLTKEELSSLMTQFVDSAKAGKSTEEGWGNSTYVVSKVGVSALSFIQQRIFDADASRTDIVVNAVHPGYVDTDMTSHKGVLTVEQGAEAPLHLALMPVGKDELKGCYVWHNKQVVDWYKKLKIKE